MIEIGFHTDAFNSSYWSFDQCLEWGHSHGLKFIECGSIDGVSWIHGLGYQPHVALWQDPLEMRRKMERLGIAFSQIDAAFPVSLPEGSTLGVEYILHTCAGPSSPAARASTPPTTASLPRDSLSARRST